MPAPTDESDDAPEQDEQPPPDDAIRRLGLGKHQPADKPRTATIPHVPAPHCGRRKAYTWAELMRRVFRIEVLTCPHCQGPRRLLAAIFDPDAIGKVLHSLGLPADPPVIAKARPPPQARLPW